MSGSGRLLPNGGILRYTLIERVMHWIAGLFYVYLLLTGLAFWSPRLYWIASMLGGGPTVRAWHPWAGVVFTLVLAWMYWEWVRDMRLTGMDRVWNRALAHYIRNEDDKLPPAGRYNAGQKLFFWLMFYCGLLLLASGVALWFTERIPWSLQWLRQLALLVHVIAALLTIGGFIIHVYMGTAVVRGGFHSVIRGEVSRRWAETHHPVWLREIDGGK
jgi:formate dehydrogenase subunit gamma